ncbi:LysR substrate-binding domain-containing protein [Marinobacter sp.]|uniref:LysR substrate-binding domain-containing protein n=1 Tax=Marinobacter sp. TaxID=50741 RepID=UPI0019C584A7|nr:LysR substrate-binding domain-containing protein [Marinobacter sp.]MBD3654938.1 LysR family transcriptional regulator [Marinobacter sp.]
MDLRKLRYFLTVAEEGNLGRAAALLHISQPPLTRQIHQLEQELGVQLFNRTPKGMELTEAGTLLAQEARNIFSLVQQASEKTQRASQGRLGRLDIAIFGSGVLDVIPRLLLRFKQDYPEVKVVLHTMEKEEQIQALRQHRITVGFNRMLKPLPDLTSELVNREPLLLAVNENSPLATQRVIEFRELADHPMVLFSSSSRPNFVDKVMSLCYAAGFTPEITQEVGDVVTGVALVASGFGVCLVSESASSLSLPGVVYREISDMPENATIDLSCVFRTGDNSRLLRSFLETLRNFKNDEMIGNAE